MAHFIGDLRGQRATPSTIGTKTSGLDADVAGWNIGAHVEIRHEDGKDVVRVYKTGGSYDSERRDLFAEFRE